MNINDFDISEKLKSELLSVISLKKIPHAVIIDRGSYKSRIDFAYYLAACTLCENDETVPCGECRNCIKVFGKIHPDVSSYEREKDRKEFSVKIIRDIIKPSVFIKPNEANGKVCIIKDAETMNASAQNAFLKILEEPPKNVMFVLCCDSSSSMLETIRSRTTVYSLDSMSDEDDEEVSKAKQLASELVDCLMLPTEYEFMKKTGVFEKDRALLTAVLYQMQIVFRNAVFIKNGASIDCDDVSVKAASFFGMSSLLNVIDKIDELNDFANKNTNLNLLLTRFCSCLRQTARG